MRCHSTAEGLPTLVFQQLHCGCDTQYVSKVLSRAGQHGVMLRTLSPQIATVVYILSIACTKYSTLLMHISCVSWAARTAVPLAAVLAAMALAVSKPHAA
jgi:hypothetical protein